ncbi:glycosyltransferase family 4 protein [Pedobacter ginsengisoli]|uniref:glycosyltransferase family 4 protein n=1 Tax=Pedobacter ginsengisoli TaxID=363852 RepID=UPI00254FC47C|nr:glycosyltransferase family 4 protein [Pedobacter ginsengisoli]
MKILFITHLFYPKVGGIEVNSEILANGFCKNGYEVHLVTWAEDPGNKAFPYPVFRKPDVWKLIREHVWADVVFENNPCLRLSWPAFFLRKKSVVALRSWVRRDDGRIGWQDKLKMKWLGRAKGVIAVSKVIRDACWPSATIIGNPYRNELFRRPPAQIYSKDFVFLGRLVGDKGADMAIKAVAGLERPATLTIIGEGPELENLKRMALDLALGSTVNFTGLLTGEELVRALNDHKYMLVPSKLIEPFGNVALEGLACGCLPIVSDGGGLPDAVGNAGIVFERGNLDALIDTISELLNDPVRENELRNNSALHLKNHHPEFVSERYLEVIEKAFKQDMR